MRFQVTKRIKQTVAWILSMAIVLSAALPQTTQVVKAADSNILAEWKYSGDIPKTNESVFPAAATGGSLTANTQLDISGIASNGTYSTKSITSTAWDMEDAAWLLSFGTKNYGRIKLSADFRSSNTGPAHLQMEYRAENGTWIPVENSQITLATGLTTLYKEIDLPECLSDCETVSLRFTKTDDTSVNGGTITNTGASNINNIVISGVQTDELTEDPDPILDDPIGINDPISDELIANIDGAIDIAEAITKTSGKATVVGQVVYQYGSNGVLDTTILEDVVNNKLVALQVYGSKFVDQFHVGDIVKVTGTMSVYGQVPQIAPDAESIEVLDRTVAAIQPWEATLAELTALGNDALSRYVVIKNVTLGEFNKENKGYTLITSGSDSINIYKAAAYPANIEAGANADVYGVYSKYNTTWQLRNGSANDYVKVTAAGEYQIETSITAQLAGWGGTRSNIGSDKIIYGDLNETNDGLNKSVELTAVKNGANITPIVTNSSYQGATGLGQAANDYYQLKFSTAKCADIKLGFTMYGSGTSPKSFDVKYSTDGTNFLDVEAITIAAASTTQAFSVNLPKDAANAEALYIRLYASTTSLKNEACKDGGNNRFQSITVTGSPISSDTICGVALAAPNSGDVLIGQEFTLASSTAGAKILYAFNGGTFLEYDPLNKPVFTELPVTVTTKTVKDGMADSYSVTYNYTQSQVLPVSVTPNGGGVSIGGKITMTTQTEGAVIKYSLDNGTTWQTYNHDTKLSFSELPVSLMVKAVKDGYKDSETTTLSFNERSNEKYNLYFGQLHSHTEYSDGSGTARQAFTYAKNTAENIDFLAITDHSNSFDNAGGTKAITEEREDAEWNEGHALADEFTDAEFVGLFGFEMTWSNGLGHINTFNTKGYQDRTQSKYTTYSTALQNYYSMLKTDTGSLSQFNHPGTTFGDFSDFAYYDEQIDAVITTIEVGNGEGAIGSSGYFPSYEYYTRALDKGWHLAPTNNQDNHKGRWGDANTARSVVLADELTRDNIYDAMRNMRMYATEDSDLSIYYTLDGNVMGSILNADSVNKDIELQVELSDPTDESIGKVQVIVNGGLVAAEKTVTANEGTVNFTLPSSYSYYYIKVIEADGHIAVTAPVWIGDVEAIGISSVETDTTLPVTGEAVDVTLSMFNNEKTDFEISSVEFETNGNVIHTVDLDTANFKQIASMGTASYTFPYVNDTPGTVIINATVKGTLDGVEKIYRGVLQLKYSTPAMVTNIVIDGTHFNDYVTGYYGANMGNFTAVAASKYAKVNIVTDPAKFTDELLETCDLLIVSAPAKKTGSANAGAYSAAHFEEDFLNTVKKYTDNGGSIIVCGLADYQDVGTSYKTSTEINKLLTAIGSTITMNDDEVYDTDNNGGQPYRLYLTDFDMSSPYLTNIVTGQTYSAYSGCSVDLTNAALDTATAKAANALVTGHATTYSINSRLDDNTAPAAASAPTVVEKGQVVSLAEQELCSGGHVFVAGTVFMSDFEVKAELDNIWDLPYANRNIVENIIESVRAELPLSTIKEARTNSALGDVFRVQGTVTAGTQVKGNIFFDTIYIQDDTAGITIFPYAGEGLKVGAKIEIVGYIDEYQGDKELQVMSSKIIDNTNLTPVQPAKMSAKDAMDYNENGGKLIQVQGRVTEVNAEGKKVSQFRIRDEKGNIATIFIDGYIYSAATSQNTLADIVKIGTQISAVGLLYLHPEGSSDTSVPCLRVRNCDEITVIQSATKLTAATVFQKTYGDKPFSLNVKTDGDGKLSYTSGNKKVCTVDQNGTVTVTGAGKAIITVTAAETLNCKKTSAAITVNVSPKAAAITVNKTAYTKTAGDKAFSLGAKSDSNGKLSYKSSNTSVCTVSSGKVTLKSAGKATITITSAATANYTKCEKKVTITVEPKTMSLSKVTSTKAKQAQATWKADKSATGYELVAATDSKFKKIKKTVKITSSKTTSKTISSLKSKTTYYVKIRAYKVSGKTKIYGDYSKAIKVKVK